MDPLSTSKRFLDFLHERRYLKNVTPSTIEWYETAFRAYQRTHGTDSPPLTRPGLQRFVVDLRERGVQPIAELTAVPLLIIDDLGMRKLPHTAAEDLLEVVMRRYERASTLLTSNRPVDDWGKLLGDTAAVAALLDRLLHHAHVLKCSPPRGAEWRPQPD
jgi:hypothetical protein